MPSSSILSVLARLRGLSLGTAMSLLAACGCSSMNNTDKGVVTGGGLGAGAGALIGAATHHAGVGALAGGALGAPGRWPDGQRHRQIGSENAGADCCRQRAAAVHHSERGRIDAAAHQRLRIIISQIRTTGSVYHLQPQDIEYLKANGVSDSWSWKCRRPLTGHRAGFTRPCRCTDRQYISRCMSRHRPRRLGSGWDSATSAIGKIG